MKSFWWLLLLISCSGINAESEEEKLTNQNQVPLAPKEEKGNANEPSFQRQIPVQGDSSCSNTPHSPKRPCYQESGVENSEKVGADVEALKQQGESSTLKSSDPATQVNEQRGANPESTQQQKQPPPIQKHQQQPLHQQQHQQKKQPPPQQQEQQQKQSVPAKQSETQEQEVQSEQPSTPEHLPKKELNVPVKHDQTAEPTQEGKEGGSQAQTDTGKLEGQNQKDVAGGEANKLMDKPSDKSEDKVDQPPAAPPKQDTKLEPPVIEEPEPKEPVKTPTEPPSEPLEKIPSFDEWKQKQLAEQAEQEKSKQLEAAAGNAPTNGSPTKNKSNKRMANFAALTCGAKLLSTNPEARNPGSVLTENKDQYMIQPCKVKKWFIIELCEPVQVRNLEIANLELFSSLPESFVAHISDRYPTKEWKALGTFHAREERTVQSFSVGDVQMFAKYIKIEMLSHYGNEHYCPLSIIRVFGTTVEEDYEDSDQPEEPPTEDDILSDSVLQQQQAGTDESSNLFDSAKDTVMSIVKNVLNTNEADNKKAVDELEKIVSSNSTLNSTLNANASVTNATSQQDQTKPCTPNPGEPDSSAEGKPSSAPTEPSTPSINTFTDEANPKNHPSPDSSNTPVVTKLETKEQDSQDVMEELVTLIERPQISLQSILQTCNFCQTYKQSSCYFDQTRTCGYFKTLHFVYPTSCVQKLPKSDGKISQSEERQPEPKHSEEAAQKSEEISTDTVAKKQPASTEGEASTTEHIQIVPTPVLPTSDQALNPDVTGQESAVKPSTSVDDPVGAHEKPTVPSSTASVTVQTDSTDKREDTVPGEKSNYNECVQKGGTVIVGSGDLGTSCTMGPDIVDVRPSTPSKAVPEETQPSDTIDTPIADANVGDEPEKVPADSQQEVPKQEQQQQPQPDQAAPQEGVKVELEANGMKNIYAEEPVTDPNELDLDSLPLPDNLEEPIQKLSSKNKETAFMRLKNRIKELELNLNLSSRYLEELSKNYKRQMEDMYTSLNKTISKLTDTSKSAETRDMRQQEYIKKLEVQVGNLTSQLTSISNSISNIHKEVIERHLFLMCIEAVLFLALLAFCIGWRRQPYMVQSAVQPQTALTSDDLRKSQSQRKDSKVKIIKDLPNKAKEDKKLKRHKRRNSIDATPPRPRGSQTVITPVRSRDDLAIRLSVSDDTITIIEPTIPAFSNPSPQDKQWDLVKQKKKKKKHQKKLSWGSDKSIYLTDTFNYDSLGGPSIETLSSASSGSISSNGSSAFRTDCAPKGLANHQTSNGAQTRPCDGSKRSLDLAPVTKPQHRRFSDQMKQNTKHLANGNISKISEKHSKVDNGQVKMNGFEDELSKLKSKSNGTIKDFSASCADENKSRGLKHWFPGIKNTVS